MCLFHNVKKGNTQTRLFLDVETKFYCSLWAPLDFPQRDSLNTLCDVVVLVTQKMSASFPGDRTWAHILWEHKGESRTTRVLTLKNLKIMAFKTIKLKIFRILKSVFQVGSHHESHGLASCLLSSFRPVSACTLPRTGSLLSLYTGREKGLIGNLYELFLLCQAFF